MSQLDGVLAILLITIVTVIDSETAQLRFVNVVFRHGNRAPDNDGNELYPNDPYLYKDVFPMGFGELTKNGKRRSLNLGLFLRDRYNDFLGGAYVPEDIMARSTDYNRTKMTLSFVLAGLYSPTPVLSKIPQINKQRIPTIFVPRELDNLLVSSDCPRYIKELDRVKSLPEVANKVESFRPFMDNLTIYTGRQINDTHDIFNLYHSLMAEYSMNLTLPDWTNDIFPNGSLCDGTVLEYDIESYSDLLKRLYGGALLKRFTDDMIATVEGTPKEARKMNLFGGHENNIAALLHTLGIYKPHVPEYTSGVIVELLENSTDYYVKVLHYLGIPSTAEEVAIPGCDVLCPLDDFLSLLENVTPTNDDLVCPKDTTLY